MEPHVSIRVYSHGFCVHRVTPYVHRVIDEFTGTLTQWGFVRKGRKFVREKLKVYAAIRSDQTEYRFQRNMLDDFLKHLNSRGLSDQYIRITHVPVAPSVPVFYPHVDTRPPREDQLPIIEHMLAPGGIKVVGLQTGKGKTFCFLTACRQLGVRCLLQIRPMYIEKWIGDVKNAYGFKPGELIAVQGSNDLRNLLQMALDKKLDNCKFIIVSNVTMQNYLKAYEQYNTVHGLYPVPPQDFYQTLGIGLKGVDEGHQHFHLNFKADCYTHVDKTIVLSATLEPDDPFLKRMYEIIYPLNCRKSGVYDKYIAVTCLLYGLHVNSRLKWKSRRGSYSHTEYEANIMKNQRSLDTYIEMLADILQKTYIKVREPGQRALVFVATKEMATLVTENFKKRYTDLKIGRYISEDDYETLLENDVSISTILSAGTAVDIPGLRIVVMSTSVSSRQSNEQVLGRLRRLADWPDITPEFYYLVCENIPEQRKYQIKKREEFENIALSQRILRTVFKV